LVQDASRPAIASDAKRQRGVRRHDVARPLSESPPGLSSDVVLKKSGRRVGDLLLQALRACRAASTLRA
jgi:hypothetical protein